MKAEAKARLEQVLAGRKPDSVELHELAAKIYADVRKEVIDSEEAKPSHFERPSFTLGLEANRLFAADRWLGRVRVGFGVWHVTLGLSGAFGRACRGDGCVADVHLFAGPEVTLHVLTSKNPRADVIDGFVRFDMQATGREGTTYDQAVIGARFLLDAI